MRLRKKLIKEKIFVKREIDKRERERERKREREREKERKKKGQRSFTPNFQCAKRTILLKG